MALRKVQTSAIADNAITMMGTCIHGMKPQHLG